MKDNERLVTLLGNLGPTAGYEKLPKAQGEDEVVCDALCTNYVVTLKVINLEPLVVDLGDGPETFQSVGWLRNRVEEELASSWRS